MDVFIFKINFNNEVTMACGNAIYAGSFNPFHAGHLNIIQRAEKYFDKITILIAVNPNKNYVVSALERKNQIESIISKLKWRNSTPKVDILGNDEFIADYAADNECKTIIKGIRNGEDLESEISQEYYNKTINPWLETMYFSTDPNMKYLSSSAVRKFTAMEEVDFIRYMKKVNFMPDLSIEDNETYLKTIYKSYKNG